MAHSVSGQILPQSDEIPSRNQMLKPGTRFILQASGFSMKPNILPGDQLHIEVSSPEKLRRGAIAVFRREGRVIAHRVVRIERGKACFVEKGDGKYMPYRLDFNSVLGRVVAVERDGEVRNLEGFTGRLIGSVIAFFSFKEYLLINFLSIIKRKLFR